MIIPVLGRTKPPGRAVYERKVLTQNQGIGNIPKRSHKIRDQSCREVLVYVLTKRRRMGP